MQEILIVLCGVAGVAAAALIRRGRRAAGSALRSERNVLGKAVSLLERDPAYASERQELLPGYQARLKEVERAIAKGDRTPDSGTTIPGGEQDAVADAPGRAGVDGDAEGAGEPGADGAVPAPATQAGVAEVATAPVVSDSAEPPESSGESDVDAVLAPATQTEVTEVAAIPDSGEPPDVGGEPGADVVLAPATQTEVTEVAAIPDSGEPPDVGGEPGADGAVPAAAPDPQIESAVPDIPEPPGGEPGTKAPPSVHSTPDTPEAGPEAGDAKMPQAGVPAGPHADTISQPGDASAAGRVEGEVAVPDAPGKGPDSAADAGHLPDTPPAAAPPKTSAGETPTQDGTGTGISGGVPPATAPKDMRDDASGRPEAGQTKGDGPAPPNPDGDDPEDLEKIKADIIKTLNRLQRAEDD